MFTMIIALILLCLGSAFGFPVKRSQQQPNQQGLVPAMVMLSIAIGVVLLFGIATLIRNKSRQHKREKGK